MATICIKLHKTGQIAKAQLQPAEDIIKVDWIDKKTGGVIKEAHYHDEVILLVQTEGFDEGETITVKIKEKDGKEFEKGVFELNLSAQVDKESYARFEVPIPITMQEGTLYVDEIECRESFRDVTLKIEECVCRDWGTVETFISKKDFVGWQYPGVANNCFDYAVHQLNKVGYDLKSKGWYGMKGGISNDVFQIYTGKKMLGMEKGTQKSTFIEGIKYLKEAIKNNMPVIVGVDNKEGADNPDAVTDHFITIVGMGNDERGNYFLFYDNAFSYDKESRIDIATSNGNRLYCSCKEYKLEGGLDRSKRVGMKVTQIRKSKKK